jgi:hypothetical protein
LAVDADNNIIVAGWTGANLHGETIASGIMVDTFIIKYDKDGNRLFTRLAGGGMKYLPTPKVPPGRLKSPRMEGTMVTLDTRFAME